MREKKRQSEFDIGSSVKNSCLTMENHEETTALQNNEVVQRKYNCRGKRHVKKKINLLYLFRSICSTRETCIEWLKNKGFIPRIMFCPNCSRKMKFESDEYAIDGYVWTCKECTFNPSQFSTRHGSWLEGIDAPLVDILLFTYLWAYGFSETEISREVHMPLSTVQEWNVMFLNICSSMFRKKMPVEDEADENTLDIGNQEECADLWRSNNKYKDPFLEFLKDADSL